MRRLLFLQINEFDRQLLAEAADLWDLSARRRVLSVLTTLEGLPARMPDHRLHDVVLDYFAGEDHPLPGRRPELLKRATSRRGAPSR